MFDRVDVDLGEARTVQVLLALVVAGPVQALGAGEDLQEQVKRPRGPVEAAAVGLFELLVDGGDLVAESAHFLGEQFAGPVGVADEFQVLALLAFEVPAAVFEVAAHARSELGLLGGFAVDAAEQLLCIGFRDLEGRPVFGDAVFEVVGAEARQVARAGADAQAQVVEVDRAVAVLAPVELEAAAAAGAAEDSLEEVVVDAFAGAATALGVEDVLDAVEEVLADQWRMAPGVLVAFPGDDAQVVAVGEDRSDLRSGQFGSGRSVLVRAGAEPGRGDRFAEVLEAVFPGGVQLEEHRDVGGAVGVGLDRLDLAAVEGRRRVQVADLRRAGGATADGFLLHLVGDVGPGSAGLVLVHAVDDGGNEVADVGVLGVVHHRDEGDAQLVQLAAGQCRVDRVAEHARAGVDDDVVDIALAMEPFHHLFERGPVLDGAARLGWFGVFVDDVAPERCCLASAGLALGRDRVAFRVEIALGLFAVGDSQVEHGPLARAALLSLGRYVAHQYCSLPK